MNRLKILVVDDESRMRKLVKDFLVKKDFEVLEAGDGEEAVDIFLEEKGIALIILDVMMPKMDGWQVCREIRKVSKVPIIMLTAKGETFDKVLGLELGADDYVVKPFELEVLYSRILALLRRSGQTKETRLFCDHLSLDTDKMSVFWEQEEILLSQPEYQLLLLLMKNKGKTVTRRQLLEQVWDSNGNYVNDNTLTVTMKRLREKLHNPTCLKTIRSFGYRLEESI